MYSRDNGWHSARHGKVFMCVEKDLSGFFVGKIKHDDSEFWYFTEQNRTLAAAKHAIEKKLLRMSQRAI